VGLGLAGLELRLHEEDEVGARCGQPEEGVGDGPQGDEGQIGDDEVKRSGVGAQLAEAEVPDVRPFPHGDPGVGAQAGVELAPAHVDRHHVGRSPLQQAVGEPTGGRAGVERDAPGGIDREPLEGGVELLASSADEARSRALEGQGVTGVDHAGRLGGGHAADEDPTGCDLGLGPIPAGNQPPAHQLRVEPPAQELSLSRDRLRRLPGRHRHRACPPSPTG
jgi:hypothetical protein